MLHAGGRILVSATTARALQSICHQNNQGVSLYHEGRCAEAVHSLKEAMFASRTSVEQCLLGEAEDTTVVELGISLQILPSQTVQAIDCDSFIDPSVYSKPFEIEMNLLSNSEAPFEQQITRESVDGEPYLLFSTLSSILIFNFALTHHARAMSSTKRIGTGQRNFLSKARDLYCLAYKSLRGEDCEKLLDPVLLHLLVQAILNNLSRCYASLDDTENSMACCKLLLKSILLSQQDRYRNQRIISSHDDKNPNDQSIELFLKNTLFLILKDPGFAPAA
ncbi:hypothetical protein IV203_021441 [Nitzschia inconspicua]|uniref:Uncharacterized protein n=1 Tax=Nitzschia inconspicua TaxID=303405 RepID=A0A9K3PE82_9STRA|nr:hypothetical protein IV203_021441 [Nitzschia inconspicua]